jgi:hypothetical protein
MKVETQHLAEIRELLVAATEHLVATAAATQEAEHQHLQARMKVQQLQAAFDVAAASFAQGTELSAAQLEQLPSAAREIF